MNRITLFAAGLLMVSAAQAVAQPAAPNPAKVCLNVSDIQRSETPDDRTIIFHMRDGAMAVLPTGLILSAVTVLLLLFTGWMGGELVFRGRVGVLDPDSTEQ